jgi:putative intracellular protease/amidase
MAATPRTQPIDPRPPPIAMKVALPLASRDYDPTEVAVPWSILGALGHEVHFATADGARAYADELMLTGEGLDPWGFIPGLKKLPVVGCVLRADANARAAHARLEGDARYQAPLRYSDLRVDDWDGVVLPGGHRARGIRPYLEDGDLQKFVAAMFDADKAVGAICHGTVVAARSISTRTGRSVLHGRKTTSLTWAQESLATRVARISRFWDPGYYRTYDEQPGEAPGFRSVEHEVTRALASPSDYRDVPQDDPEFEKKTDGRHRDSLDDTSAAFVVEDGRYVSARWPGDAHLFAKTFSEVLRRGAPRPNGAREP